MSAHPYMANSAPALREELREAVGVATVDELFAQIPADHISGRGFALPPTLASEVELARHLRRTLSANVDCEQALSFLGGGCWQHHVPAICDEIASRTEFLTPVWGPLLGPRPQPGLVRVREPARRAARAGLLRAAGLLVGLRGGPRDPHGGAHHAPPARARAGVPGPRTPRRDPHLLRAGGDGEPHRRRPRGLGRRQRRARRRRDRAAARRDDVAAVYFEQPGRSARSRPSASGSPRSRARAAPRRSSASTRSRSACSRRPASTAPTSPSARRSRWASNELRRRRRDVQPPIR